MKTHKSWTVITGYFKDIPINNDFIYLINKLLKENKYILIMIQKENPETNPKFTAEEKFSELCKLYENETKIGRIIISKVPEIDIIHRIKA